MKIGFKFQSLGKISTSDLTASQHLWGHITSSVSDNLIAHMPFSIVARRY